MGSSLGFGSSACDYGSCDPRPIQTRFRFGFGRQALTSPHTANSPDHSSIGTPSRYRDESRQHASTACRHTVSVSISLPSRGAFHLSLTVLVHYRSLEVFSLRQWSDWFPTQETFRVVLESSDRRLIAFAYRAITVSGGPFQAASVWHRAPMSRSHNPSRASTTGLGWPDFARRYFRDRGCFLFLRVLRCFSSPGLPLACARSSVLRPMGLPHSEILGSQLVCSSPRLIAAYHVLHRLPVPRHPPCALTRLIS